MALNRSPEFHWFRIKNDYRSYFMTNIHDCMWPCCISGLNNLARDQGIFLPKNIELCLVESNKKTL